MSKDHRATRRKKHRNSKLGCQTCKRRRVKCSETLPECNNCVKHGSRCEYLEYDEAKIEEFKKAKKEYQSNSAVSKHRRRSTDTSSIEEVAAVSAPNLSLHERPYLVLCGEFEHNGGVRPDSTQTAACSSYQTIQRMSLPGYDGEDRSFNSERPSINSPYISPTFSAVDSKGAYFRSLVSGKAEVSHLKSFMQTSSVRQAFDDLLTQRDHQIIYPVYTVDSWSNASSSVVSSVQSEYGNDVGQDAQVAGKYGGPVADRKFSIQKFHGSLPNSIKSKQTFKVLHSEDMDFEALLNLYVIDLGPLIAQGKAKLPQIRNLYHAWLGHFFSRAFKLSTMFSCLINLTTNYLITNVFRRREPVSLGSANQVQKVRKSLLIYLIQHYSRVIRNLGSLLNNNSDPELASSVSYILSLMSIYDPEATVDSTVCFRDGMFSVLSYTLQLSKSLGLSIPSFVPIHMQLGSNIVRTVYFPAYKPDFLNEFEVMLKRLGSLIGSVKPTEALNSSTFKFIVEAYEDLSRFCQESVQVHIPTVNQNLANIPLQLDVLFCMFRKWANFGPSRLLTISKSTDPIEKVLNLYFRLFRKAVYAVVPQVKFCFLRDFDSPLMLDVFPSYCDASMLSSLESPEIMCLVPEAYSRILGELKFLAAYAIRVITFLNLRIEILYRNLVYNEKARRLYPIDNIVDWKNSISDIQATRSEFLQRIGLREECILLFNQNYISKIHYPLVVDSRVCDERMNSPISTDDMERIIIDLTSLRPNGLLEQDEWPPNDSGVAEYEYGK